MRLSIRSSAPPIPGMELPESFTLAFRLKPDSTRSPICPTMEISRARPAAVLNSKLKPVRFWLARLAANTAVITAIIVPPMAPYQVFLGLSLGAILCRPRYFPVRSAPISVNFAVMRTQIQRNSPNSPPS